MNVIDQEQLISDGLSVGVLSTRSLAQTFKSTGGKLRKIKVLAGGSGADEQAQITFEIQETTGGLPNGTVIFSKSYAVWGATNGEWFELNISGNINLTKGATYGLCIFSSDSSAGNPDNGLSGDQNGNLYPDGSLLEERGSGWVTVTTEDTPRPDADLCFQIWVDKGIGGILTLGSGYTGSTAETLFSTKVTPTRMVTAWQESTTVKKVQVFDIDPDNGDITPKSTALTFYTSSVDWSDENLPSITVLNDTKFVILFKGGSGDGFCRSFQINESTGEITYWGALYEFDTLDTDYISSCLMDTNHILATYLSNIYSGIASILEVNMSTGNITLIYDFEYHDGHGSYNSVIKLSSTKALVCYNGPASDGFSVVLSINTSTWFITLANSSYEWLNGSTISQNSVTLMTENTALNAFNNENNLGIRPLSINTSTWALTNIGSGKTGMATSQNQYNSKNVIFPFTENKEYFALFYKNSSGNIQVSTYTFNPSNGAIGTDPIDSRTLSAMKQQSVSDMGDGLFVSAYADGSEVLKIQAFKIQTSIPPTTNQGVLRRRLLV